MRNFVMSATIESTHNKLMEKISLVNSVIDRSCITADAYRAAASSRVGRKYIEVVRCLDGLNFNLLRGDIVSLENEYTLAVASTLEKYYGDKECEDRATREYNRVVTSENIVARVGEVVARLKSVVVVLRSALNSHIYSKADAKESEYELDRIISDLDRATNLRVDMRIEKRPYETCKCGSRMSVVPELSELWCESQSCGKVKTIIGAVFRDDQFYPQDGQKSKHGGYDTSRHYRFWMERLQAREAKTFTDTELENIEYVIRRDGYRTNEINCEIMRYILKDPKVDATYLNDHVPRLVRQFGGRVPPQLNHKEDRMCSIRFSKAMRLYEMVNPDGGNKPYYPYFIYKIIEEMFKNDSEKIRLLDYIHLQSRETVIKNDKFYERICELADPVHDGLVYRSTDPASRL